jgi:predicted esterase
MLNDFIHQFTPGRANHGVTILALHGTGGDEHDLLPLVRMIDPDAAVLSPRGRVLENGMPRFFRRLAEGVFDQEDLRRRTEELATFVGEAAAQYGFDPSRVMALGYSNGANIAASVLLARPEVLAGGMLLRPMVPFEPERLPDLTGKRILISAGRLDEMIPQALTERLATLLEQSGAEVTTWWHPTGHNLTHAEPARIREWYLENARSA